MQKKWLHPVPWDNVLTVNKALCQAQKLEPLSRPVDLEKARILWENAMSRSLSLKEVLDVCRECHELAPFTFNNGNTFAAVGRTVIEECIRSLPPVEGQIVQTTVSHYIAGLIGRRELLQVLKHFEGSWKLTPTHSPEIAQPRKTAAPVLSHAQPQA
ncbi:MAG: hypothetical protein QOF48_1154 [Verrucomicrobiota bacterium]|jgi:hypothetical protein